MEHNAVGDLYTPLWSIYWEQEPPHSKISIRACCCTYYAHTSLHVVELLLATLLSVSLYFGCTAHSDIHKDETTHAIDSFLQLILRTKL